MNGKEKDQAQGISRAAHSVMDSWPTSKEQNIHEAAVFSQSLERFAFLFECKVCRIFFLLLICDLSSYTIKCMCWCGGFNFPFNLLNAKCGREMSFGYTAIPLCD